MFEKVITLSQQVRLYSLPYLLLLFFIFNTHLVQAQYQQKPPNILVILVDDLGIEVTQGYNFNLNQACSSDEFNVPYLFQAEMPTLQKLQRNGVTFDNFWTTPVCAPSRASLVTGKHGIENGIRWVSDGMTRDEQSIFEYIRDNAPVKYDQAAFGKWNLAVNLQDSSLLTSLRTLGVEHFEGIAGGRLTDYNDWPLMRFTENTSGVVETTTETTYATTKWTDLAMNWINHRSNSHNPFFAYVAYNAPHDPWHVPPGYEDRLAPLPPCVGFMEPADSCFSGSLVPYYRAIINTMDSEIGRLISSIPAHELDNTVIIFASDNGSPLEVIQPPFGRAKAKITVFQGGVNVPLVVSGAGVTRKAQREDALIGITDMFATIANIAGVGVNKYEESYNFSSLFSDRTKNAHQERDFLYTDLFLDPRGRNTLFRNYTDDYAVRDDTYKYIYDTSPGSSSPSDPGPVVEYLFNLRTDPYECNNLLEGTLSNTASNALQALRAEGARIRKETTPPPPTFSCDNININGGQNSLSITGLIAPNQIVQVFDQNWQKLLHCINEDCGNSQQLKNLSPGTYRVKVDFYTASWQPLCATGIKEVAVTGRDNTGQGPCQAVSVAAEYNAIQVSGLNTPIAIVKVLDKDNGWRIAYQCVANCGRSLTTRKLYSNNYLVQVQLYSSSWELLCEQEYDVQMYGGLVSTNTARSGAISNETAATPTMLTSNKSVEEQDFKLFPNPAFEELTIVTPVDLERPTFHIYNLQGQEMAFSKNTPYQSTTARIDVSNYTSGLYLLSIRESGTIVYSTTFLVE